MGLRMDDLHAPTVASGPTSRTATNGVTKEQSFKELIEQKENLEAELSALGSVLDSVCYSCPLHRCHEQSSQMDLAWRSYEYLSDNL